MYKFANDSSGVSAVSAPVSGGSSPAHSAMPSPKAPLSGPSTGMAMRKLSYSFLAKAAQEVLGGSPYRQTPLAKLAEGLITPEALRRGYLQHGATAGAVRGGLVGGALGGALNLYEAAPQDRNLETFTRGAVTGGVLGAGAGAGAGAYHGHALHGENKPFLERRTPSGVASVPDIVHYEFRHPGRLTNETLQTDIPAGLFSEHAISSKSEPSALAKMVAQFREQKMPEPETAPAPPPAA